MRAVSIEHKYWLTNRVSIVKQSLSITKSFDCAEAYFRTNNKGPADAGPLELDRWRDESRLATAVAVAELVPTIAIAVPVMTVVVAVAIAIPESVPVRRNVCRCAVYIGRRGVSVGIRI